MARIFADRKVGRDRPGLRSFSKGDRARRDNGSTNVFGQESRPHPHARPSLCILRAREVHFFLSLIRKNKALTMQQMQQSKSRPGFSHGMPVKMETRTKTTWNNFHSIYASPQTTLRPIDTQKLSPNLANLGFVPSEYARHPPAMKQAMLRNKSSMIEGRVIVRSGEIGNT
jgi:hypothetical protein